MYWSSINCEWVLARFKRFRVCKQWVLSMILVDCRNRYWLLEWLRPNVSHIIYLINVCAVILHICTGQITDRTTNKTHFFCWFSSSFGFASYGSLFIRFSMNVIEWLYSHVYICRDVEYCRLFVALGDADMHGCLTLTFERWTCVHEFSMKVCSSQWQQLLLLLFWRIYVIWWKLFFFSLLQAHVMSGV